MQKANVLFFTLTLMVILLTVTLIMSALFHIQVKALIVAKEGSNAFSAAQAGVEATRSSFHFPAPGKLIAANCDGTRRSGNIGTEAAPIRYTTYATDDTSYRTTYWFICTGAAAPFTLHSYEITSTGTFRGAVRTSVVRGSWGQYIARWDMNEGRGTMAWDRTRNNNHGALRPGPAPNFPTWEVGHLRFDGVDDFVNVPDSASLNIVHQISVGGWLFWDGGDIWHWNNVFIKRFHHHAGSEHFGLFLHRTGRHAHYCSVIGGHRVCLDSPTNSIPINQWFHIMITYDGSHQRIFINGTQVAIVARTGLMTANSEPFIMGGYICGGANVDHFSGLIDEVSIYNRALTAAEVTASFRRDCHGRGLPPALCP